MNDVDFDELMSAAWGITVPRRPEYVPPTYVYSSEFAGERPRGRRLRAVLTVIVIAVVLIIGAMTVAFADPPTPVEPTQPTMSPPVTIPPAPPPAEGD